MITGYTSGHTWLHRTPAGVKLAILAALSTATMSTHDWRLLSIVLSFTLMIYVSLGREVFRSLILLRPVIPLLLAISFIQGWTVAWNDAAASVMRLLVMITAASLITLTTTMQAMMAALAPMLAPLNHLGVNPRAPALAVALVLRLAPVLLSTWQQREEAWRARTGRRISIRLIPAFLAEALTMADYITEALDARGFDPRVPKRPKGNQL
jgi:biotin transport system permease protein